MPDQPKKGAVKICGIREVEHAIVAADAGANYLGFILAPSRRQVTPDQVRTCLRAVREAFEQPPLAVGVFVNSSVEEMNSAIAEADLDLVQIHGNAESIDLSEVTRPALVAFHPELGSPRAAVEASMHSLLAGSGRPPIAYLVDGHQAGHYGGVGVRADWTLAQELARDWPIILAGGLNPENVGEAVSVVVPTAVDVSSGIETDGVKDPVKIRAFVEAARSAFRRALAETAETGPSTSPR